LQIFAYLIDNDRCGVTEVADVFGLALPIASLYLRALNARGLLASERSGRYVRYSVAPNPSVQGADALVCALRVAFAEGRADEDIFRDFTAFTHPRRVEIVRVLSDHGGMYPVEIRRACKMSIRALRRHLAKLEQRGFITRLDHRVSSRRPDSRLARVLVELAQRLPLS